MVHVLLSDFSMIVAIIAILREKCNPFSLLLQNKTQPLGIARIFDGWVFCYFILEGSTGSFSKSGLRRKFASEQGGKPQEYFMYFKV
jgi:hypothetical protein